MKKIMIVMVAIVIFIQSQGILLGIATCEKAMIFVTSKKPYWGKKDGKHVVYLSSSEYFDPNNLQGQIRWVDVPKAEMIVKVLGKSDPSTKVIAPGSKREHREVPCVKGTDGKCHTRLEDRTYALKFGKERGLEHGIITDGTGPNGCEYRW